MVTQLQEAVPVQRRQLALRPPDRALPLPAGLVGQEVQLQVLLQPLALHPGDGQVRVQGWVLGAGVPAALRLFARLLQPPQRALQLRPRVPGQELPGALPGGEIRVAVCAQVSWGHYEGENQRGTSVPLAGWGDM